MFIPSCSFDISLHPLNDQCFKQRAVSGIGLCFTEMFVFSHAENRIHHFLIARLPPNEPVVEVQIHCTNDHGYSSSQSNHTFVATQ